MAIYLGANELATGGGGGSSNIKTNPLEMPISVVGLGFIDTQDWAVSTFWDEPNRWGTRGTYKQNVFSANKTELINVTNGSGYLYNVIANTSSNFGVSLSHIYITVDGIEYEITGTVNKSTWAYDRLVFGYVDTSNNVFRANPNFTSNESLPYIQNCMFLPQGNLEMIQAPILRFETSLKVEVKIDVYSNQENAYRAGVSYRIDS